MFDAVILTSVWALESVDQSCRFSYEIKVLNLNTRDEDPDSREHTQRTRNRYECIAAVLVIECKLNPMTGRLKEALIYEPKSDDPGVGTEAIRGFRKISDFAAF